MVDLETMVVAIKQRCKGCFILHTPGKLCTKKRVQKKILQSNIKTYIPTKVELQAILARVMELTGTDCVLCCLEHVHICNEDLLLEKLTTELPSRRGGDDMPEEVILVSLRMAGGGPGQGSSPTQVRQFLYCVFISVINSLN